MGQDEGRFGRISDIRTCWAPKGVRPKIAKQIVRSFVYVYAAICMALGKMTSLILPYVNTEMMNLFLEQVSMDFKDYFVIMLVDGAGWHRAESLKVPENIRLWCRSSIVDTNSLSCLLLFVVLALKGHGRKIAQFFLFSLTIIKKLNVFRDVFNGLLPSSVVTMKNQFTL